MYHVKGGGAFGHFEVTADVTEWSHAAFLKKIGKRTPLGLRFSIVAADEVPPTRNRALNQREEDRQHRRPPAAGAPPSWPPAP